MASANKRRKLNADEERRDMNPSSSVGSTDRASATSRDTKLVAGQGASANTSLDSNISSQEEIHAHDNKALQIVEKKLNKKRKKKKKKKKKHGEENSKFKKKKHNQKVQMFLDFGQKAFSKRKCPKCQMLYAPGRPDDESAHSKFCRRVSRPVQIHARTGDDIVWSSDFHGKHATVLKFHGEDNIRISELFSRVQAELDASFDISANKHSSRIGSKKPLVYVHIVGRSAVGYLSVSLLKATETSSKRLQVQRLWVHPAYRRKGVATHLLDLARAHSVYGTYIGSAECTMPDRTMDGSHFWSTYVSPREKQHHGKR